MRPSSFRRLATAEATPGVLLALAALVAMLVANSPLASSYEALWTAPIFAGATLRHVIDDGLMTLFFLLVGLEIKQELQDGGLGQPRAVALPALGALGGMLVPSLVYVAFNRGDGFALRGWAIPAATDIAFAVGVLSLLGRRVPSGLKTFLLTLAILDDLGAIVIIAAFYTADLDATSLVLAGGLLVALLLMGARGVRSLAAYVLVGLALWACVLRSGVHATLAGVALAFALPLRTEVGESPARRLRHALHPWVMFGILPVFALASSGVSLAGLPVGVMLHPVALGVGVGLFVGKAVGVVSFARLAVSSRVAVLPAGVTWSHVFGASLLCGIGFTMSLFITALAFGDANDGTATIARLGTLAGSLASAVAGTMWLWRALPPRRSEAAHALRREAPILDRRDTARGPMSDTPTSSPPATASSGDH